MQATDKFNGKSPVLVIIGILAIFCTMSEFTILTPSIAAFAAHFQNTDMTTIMLANSITGIVSVPVSIASGAVLHRIGFRPAAIVGIVIMTLSGAFPFLMPDMTDYTLVIGSRIGVGIGLGIMFPVGAASIIAFFDGEMRTRLLGLGMVCQFVFSILYTIVAGNLTEIAWNYSFLTYLIAFVPLVAIILFMPEAKGIVAADRAAQASRNQVKEKVPHGIWGYAVYGLMVWIGLVTVQLLCSTVLSERALGDSSIAGLIISCCGVGIIVSSIILPYMVRLLKKYIFAFCAALVAIGMIPCFLADSAIMYGVGVFIIGIGGSSFFNASQNAAGNITPVSRVPFVSGVMTSMMNLGPFFAPYMYAASAAAIPAFGQSSAFLTCGVVCAVCAVLGLVLPLKGLMMKRDDGADAGLPVAEDETAAAALE